jgi:hypothetical protein
LKVFDDKETGNPYQFIRKIDEGGYTKIKKVFNQSSNKSLVKIIKKQKEKFCYSRNIQDILSTFYYLRNHPNIDKIKTGESIAIDMFFDDETTNLS